MSQMSQTRELGVLIVDDEEPARMLLRELLERQPGYRVIGEAADGFEAVRIATQSSPDIALLDIEMPKLDGFEVAELLDPSVAVVFVTAYDHYAVKAFEVHAADYVLKPYRAERLAEALARSRDRVRDAPRPDAAALSAAVRGDRGYRTRIAVRERARVHVISVEKLDMAESQDDYVVLKSEGKKFQKPQTLASLAASLDPVRFVRVHRSYVVNVDRIRAIEEYAKNSHVAILADGSRVPVSREGYARLRDAGFKV
jgi:two-component system, LytTR family, response regulator